MRIGGGTGVGLVVTLALAGAATSWAAPPLNDDFGSRLSLQLGIADTRSNAEAGIESGERLTENDPGGLGCGKKGEVIAGGIQMGATMWWSFTGSGGPVTVSSLGSNFDTVLAVYEADGKTVVACNDDIQPRDPSRENLAPRLASEVLIDTVAGQAYTVQVGACVPPEACGKATGNVTLRISDTPPNDNRADAKPIAAGAPVVSTNTGATAELGESTACGLSLYDKTVWFRYTAPAIGTAAFSAAGFDTVIALYRGDSTTPLDCNDEAVAGQTGASRLPTSQPVGAPIEVVPGDYLLQVGGYYDPGFSTIAARNGPLEVQVEFSEDTDVDNDGVDRDRDCNDADTAIRPGLPENPNNDVDENCDGIRAYDRDGDRFFAPPVGEDCDDTNAKVRPFLPERSGNRIDENCDRIVAPPEVLRASADMQSVRLPGSSYSLVKLLFVRDVVKGSHVKVRCLGECSIPMPGKAVKRNSRKLILATDFRVKAGTKVDVRVTKPTFIGRGMTFSILADRRRMEHEYCLDLKGNPRDCPRD